ncbi:Electron transport complex protein RnfA [uncultured Candidatus Thioglobus sp.]|nr:Electron transport complex protein RnfA [uncultured Candidatus Thioglobus sp.]
MTDIFIILLGAALINNIAVTQVLAADPILAISHKDKVAWGFSYAMLLLLPITTVLATSVTNFLLLPLGLQYLQIFIFVLLIIIVVYALMMWSARGQTNSQQANLKKFLPLAGINTTVLGCLLLNHQQHYNLLDSFFFSLGTAIGFTLILAMITAINKRLEFANVPKSFQGIPIMLITLGLLSIAFLGFTGLAR